MEADFVDVLTFNSHSQFFITAQALAVSITNTVTDVCFTIPRTEWVIITLNGNFQITINKLTCVRVNSSTPIIKAGVVVKGTNLTRMRTVCQCIIIWNEAHFRVCRNLLPDF
ncbi:hypothetical protein HLBS07_32860 [Vibrio alginolyticus]|nr:hypothetical protein HLBS07_32860 [Vibrio alginolyticus]